MGRRRNRPLSLHLGAGGLHHGGPFRDLGLDVGGECLGRARRHLDADVVECLEGDRIGERRDGGASERTEPDLMCPITEAEVANMTWTWPPITSCSAGAAPL